MLNIVEMVVCWLIIHILLNWKQEGQHPSNEDRRQNGRMSASVFKDLTVCQSCCFVAVVVVLFCFLMLLPYCLQVNLLSGQMTYIIINPQLRWDLLNIWKLREYVQLRPYLAPASNVPSVGDRQLCHLDIK